MRLRVGLVGAGHIGQFHARAVRGICRRELVDAEYVAVADLDRSRAEHFAAIANLTICSDDPATLLDDPSIDAIYICTPTRQHRELVLRAAAAGKAIFCEKPLAVDLSTARELASAVTEAGVVNQVGLVLRFSPILHVLKALCSDPRLGRLMTIVFRDDQFFPIQGHYGSTWRGDVKQAGGGTLLEHSIHDLDLLRWLAGDPVWLSAQTRNFAGHPGIEDLAMVQIGFADGGVANLISVWHNVLSRPSLRRIELFYENGYFAIEHDFLGPIHCHTVWGGQNEIDEEQVFERYVEVAGITGDALRDIARRWSLEDYSFLLAASRKLPAMPDFATALEAQALVDAAYRSAATHETVTFAPARP